MTIIELRNKRAQKLAAAKAFLESNRNQDGFLSEEDDATYTRLETEIGYKPRVRLHEGIRHFIDWYTSDLNPLK